MVDVDVVQTPAQWRAALAALIQRKHLTHDAIENRGVARATLSNVLTGKSECPRWRTLGKILGACAVTGEELAAWERAYQRAYGQGVGVLLTAELDPFELGVHKAITADHSGVAEGLTVYVPRPHDARLTEIVDTAAGGRSAMVVLLGDSSTGKTRALWEAVARLQDLGGWRLWHPTSPNRRTALNELGWVRPRTVVWLNETQEYLGGDNRAGDEDAAVALRDLVRDPARAPVLVVGTLWRSYYGELCRSHASQARNLLETTATVIEVPSTFADADPTALTAAAATDPRMEMARGRSEDGRISQYLAGGPELVRRYEFELSPAAQAIVEIAMDARRMGHRNAIPLGLFADATHAYMTSSDWNRVAAASDWLEQALADTARPCKGAEGPLTRIVPAPLRSRTGRDPAGHGGPAYKLADYLDQYGRPRRRDGIPPIPFWETAAAHAGPQDLRDLGAAAWDRGLYREAAQLWKNAARHGDGFSAERLLTRLPMVFPDDEQPSAWAIDHLSVDEADSVGWLLEELQELGLVEQATMIANRATTETHLDRTLYVAGLLELLKGLGLIEQATAIANRAITETALDDVYAGYLLSMLRQLGLIEQATTIANRATTETHLDNDAEQVGTLVEELLDLGLIAQATTIANRATTETRLKNWFDVRVLLEPLKKAGLTEQATTIVDRATTETSLDQASQVAAFLDSLRNLGLTEQATTIADRATTETSLDQASEVAAFLDSLRNLGLTEQATTIADRATTETSLDSLRGVWSLMEALVKLGLTEQAATISKRITLETIFGNAADLKAVLTACRHYGHFEAAIKFADLAATMTSLDEPFRAAALLDLLRNLGLTEQATLIAERATTQTALNNLHGAATLLDSLRKLNLTEQATTIAERAITKAANAYAGASELVDSLRILGLTEQAAAFIQRLPAAAMFTQFRECSENPGAFRFGREPDGSPAGAWSWSDLD
ncbi:hypothetical protein [Nocardia sp. N2S4-5]|uniref:hypothetical protein n=1 Tax=Nocardia sp. N2S4-5 TaxID=3351565 RepID=UPI0037CD8034